MLKRYRGVNGRRQAVSRLDSGRRIDDTVIVVRTMGVHLKTAGSVPMVVVEVCIKLARAHSCLAYHLNRRMSLIHRLRFIIAGRRWCRSKCLSMLRFIIRSPIIFDSLHSHSFACVLFRFFIGEDRNQSGLGLYLGL